MTPAQAVLQSMVVWLVRKYFVWKISTEGTKGLKPIFHHKFHVHPEGYLTEHH